MGTILYHGFRFMFAAFILVAGAAAFLLFLAGASSLIREATSHKVAPQPSVVADCHPPVHPAGAKISEGQRIMEAYDCLP